MDLNNYCDSKKQLQNSILTFLNHENTEEEDENFPHLLNLIQDQQIASNKDELTALFYLIGQIEMNYRRSPDFNEKIQKIISIFESEIKNLYTNIELFHIFEKNKRIFLYLIQKKLVTVDQKIVTVFTRPKFHRKFYFHYFYPEIKNFISDEKLKNEIEKSVSKYSCDLFEKLRQNGENEEEICRIIRNDSISDFTSHVSNEKRNIFEPIRRSIFETNNLLLKRDSSLIEYAAFFGSVQIFQYLMEKKCKITPDLWFYAIHGQNFEILNILKQNKLRSKDYTFGKALDESFKCHNNDVTDFVIENLARIRKGDEISFYSHSIKFYNYDYFPDDLNNQFSFCYLCYADNVTILKELVNLSKKNFKINEQISSVFFF